jgi:hypothetical protein
MSDRYPDGVLALLRAERQGGVDWLNKRCARCEKPLRYVGTDDFQGEALDCKCWPEGGAIAADDETIVIEES